MTQPQRREAVTWNRDGAIVEIVLGRPPANALGLEIITGLHTAMDYAQDVDAKVIVVASAVEGFFAAGADIKHMSAIDATSFREYGDALRGALERLAALPMISVAAVDGLALGGGLELAMACTLRVGAARARLGLPEVKLGLIPGAGGTQRLPRLIGRGRALDLMLTARQIEADEAFWIGLIDRLAEPETTARATAFSSGVPKESRVQRSAGGNTRPTSTPFFSIAAANSACGRPVSKNTKAPRERA